MKKVNKVIAWVDVGSNGGIFEFQMGPVAQRYPHLMHVFSEQITTDLIPVVITAYKPRRAAKRRVT